MFISGVNVKETCLRLEAGLVASKSLELEVDSPPNLTVGWQYGDLPTRRPSSRSGELLGGPDETTLTMPGQRGDQPWHPAWRGLRTGHDQKPITASRFRMAFPPGHGPGSAALK